MTLEEIAWQLYGLAPREFTAARNAHAKEATSDGHKDLAAALRALPKPTVVAWSANMLSRRRPSDIEDLIALGPELRHAQNAGLRADLRRLVDRRRALVRVLIDAASDSARDAGQSFTTRVERQLEETLEAAVADEAMAAVLRQGRLSEPLRFVGFGESSETTDGTGRSPDGAEHSDRARRADAAAHEAAHRGLRASEEALQEALHRHETATERRRAASTALAGAGAKEASTADALRQARHDVAQAKRDLKKAGRRFRDEPPTGLPGA